MMRGLRRPRFTASRSSWHRCRIVKQHTFRRSTPFRWAQRPSPGFSSGASAGSAGCGGWARRPESSPAGRAPPAAGVRETRRHRQHREPSPGCRSRACPRVRMNRGLKRGGLCDAAEGTRQWRDTRREWRLHRENLWEFARGQLGGDPNPNASSILPHDPQTRRHASMPWPGFPS
jgi:hypothetical protein